ncbi:hypothetical protein NL529_34630, partial [Klebsiella pneumoniae]|nr:hypothetical protein [Klebsiella pneumoniae]
KQKPASAPGKVKSPGKGKGDSAKEKVSDEEESESEDTESDETEAPPLEEAPAGGILSFHFCFKSQLIIRKDFPKF